MTITYYDKFALLPKRCSKCNRLFVFEGYNIYYKSVAFGRYDLKQKKCKKCINKDKGEVN